MIDERIRIQENYDMTLETAIDEAREEGLVQVVWEQGLEKGKVVMKNVELIARWSHEEVAWSYIGDDGA